MAPIKKHEAWLKFLGSILDIASSTSRGELQIYRSIAHREYQSAINVIDGLDDFMARAESEAVFSRPSTRKRGKQVHLFDLLRDRTLFPQNLDLSRFAARVVPSLRTARHGKISRADIAARVIEYLENSDPRTRHALEESMRDALKTLGKDPANQEHNEKRSTFFSKWESIIKGFEL